MILGGLDDAELRSSRFLQGSFLEDRVRRYAKYSLLRSLSLDCYLPDRNFELLWE